MSSHQLPAISEGYIVFSDPVLEALDEAGVDLKDILERASKQTGLDMVASARLAPDPAAASGTRALDPATIVAAAAVIAVLTPAVVRIVEAVVRSRAVTREREFAPVIDAKGEAVLGPNGQPVVAWREREERGTASPEAGMGVRIRAFGVEIDLVG
jgi:hypothetical protein